MLDVLLVALAILALPCTALSIHQISHWIDANRVFRRIAVELLCRAVYSRVAQAGADTLRLAQKIYSAPMQYVVSGPYVATSWVNILVP